MTLKQLKQTPWAKRFKEDCGGSSYERAIELAMDKDLEFDIYKNDETGVVQYSIIPVGEYLSRQDSNFWMDSFKKRKDAISLIEEMGWKLVK